MLNTAGNIGNYSRNALNILTSSPALTGAAVYTLYTNHDDVIPVIIGSILAGGVVVRIGYSAEKTLLELENSRGY